MVIALGAAPAGATQREHVARNGTSGVVVTHVTLTAGRRGGDSAVSLHFTNLGRHAVVLRTVSSPVAKVGMLHFDVNMCDSGSVMIMLPNLRVSGHSRTRLGTKGTGAMLQGLRSRLSVGTRVLLKITWTTTSGSKYVTPVTAIVVKKPRHLHFGMSSMSSMPGM